MEFNTTNNVYEANNPHFTAETIKNRQLAEFRRLGERGGRLLGGRD